MQPTRAAKRRENRRITHAEKSNQAERLKTRRSISSVLMMFSTGAAYWLDKNMTRACGFATQRRRDDEHVIAFSVGPTKRTFIAYKGTDNALQTSWLSFDRRD
jgi:hypothetical protein